MTIPYTGTTPNGALSRRQRYELISGQLELDRASFIPSWRDQGDFIQPRRARFFVSDTNKGDRRNQKIIDSTATFAMRTLSSGMMSGVTSPARPWFRLTTPDPDLSEQGDVKEWLHTVTSRMNTVFLRSNLYNKLPILYGDLGTFGTAVMLSVEDPETTVRFIDLPIGSYLLGNDAQGRVRILHRTFQMTVRQMVEQFCTQTKSGYDLSPLSIRTQNLWNTGNREQWIPVCHIILPNDQYNPNYYQSKYKRFASCYYEQGSSAQSPDTTSDQMLLEEGFDEFPAFAVRWGTTGEDVYGTECPGSIALGDIKQLQLGTKRVAQAIDKLVNPPMIAPAQMARTKLSILPGDTTFGDGDKNSSFRPVFEMTNPRIAEQENLNQQVRLRIQRACYEDLFLMLAQSDRREITAREIDERHEEKLLALGPVLEQLNQDLLDPLVDRVFAIMLRNGQIPQPPESLSGASLKVEYISVMAQAQKLVGISSLDRFASFTFQAAAVDPSVLDKVNRDQLIQEYGDATGIAPKILVPDEQVAQVRQARAQAAQAQAHAAQVAQMTASAKNLSQSDTSGKNALTDLIGASTPSQPGVAAAGFTGAPSPMAA